MASACVADVRYSVEKVDLPCCERVFSPDDKEAVFFHPVFEDRRSVSQVIGGGPDICPDNFFHQFILIRRSAVFEKGLRGRADPVHNGFQVFRPAFRRLDELVDCRLYRSAIRVAKDDDETGAAVFNSELNAANAGWCRNIAGDTNDEKVPESLVKNDFSRNAGVRAAEDYSEGLLATDQFGTTLFAGKIYRKRFAGGETLISFLEAIECGNGSVHD